MSLYIYATSFNNANRVDACLDSLAPLKPKMMVVADNLSVDGTAEKLKAHGVKVISERCTMGRGRQLAMEAVLAVAKDNDKLIYIDTDTVYKKKVIDLIRRRCRTIKHNQMSMFSGISTARTNRKFPWSNLPCAEDAERVARAKTHGCELLDSELQWKVMKSHDPKVANQYYENEATGSSTVQRNKRYAKGIRLLWRMSWIIINQQRGEAHKSFQSYYAICKQKSLFNKCAYFIGYHIANLIGTYSYDKKLSNPEIIHGKPVH